MAIFEEANMKKDSPLYYQLTEDGQRVAKERAKLLEKMLEAPKTRTYREAVTGCNQCKARMENPHADYHLTQHIDASKF